MNQKTILKIIKELNKLYDVKFRKENPFRLLIGVLLSQRTRDEVSWPANDRLFDRAKNVDDFLKLSQKEIEKIIYPVGFYRQKAKRIKQICKILLEKYNEKVPNTREELMKLPGVGPKTADIVLCYSYGLPVIAVDTHVAAVSKRLHLTKYSDPEKIREDLHRQIPEKLRAIVNLLFVGFGKDICRTIKPKCYICPIVNLCLYKHKNL
jgi:endonuclease-3